MSSVIGALNEAARPKRRQLPPDTQQVCIDLPGEAIRCVVYKPKLEIMLRKHRDVIFDLQLFRGMQYTVEADKSDFYNARDKKIVLRARKQKVTFTDGERLHLWVGRNFKGNLILKANGKLLGRYNPDVVDCNRYDDEPTTKPAPLIVVMKNSPEAAPPTTANGSPSHTPDRLAERIDEWTLKPIAGSSGATIYSSPQSSISTGEQHPVIAVVDVTETDMPQKLLAFFAAGGGKSGLVDIDPHEVATRNWLFGQLAGAAAYAGDNWNWLRHSINRQADGAFKLVTAKISRASGKVRVYFAGYSSTNPVFGPGGHSPQNSKILQVYAGVGNIGSAFKAATKAIAGTFQGNALVSFIFGAGTSFAEWQADAEKDGYDLFAALLSTLIKTIIAAAATAIVVAAILVVLMIAFKVAVSALVVGGLVVSAGLVLNYAVEAGDKALGRRLAGATNSDGVAAVAAPWLRDVGKEVGDVWNALAQKFPKDYAP